MHSTTPEITTSIMLVVVPCLYLMLEDLRGAVGRVAGLPEQAGG